MLDILHARNIQQQKQKPGVCYLIQIANVVFEQKYRANQEMYNYTEKVYIHCTSLVKPYIIENKYKSYALADDKVFNGSVSP